MPTLTPPTETAVWLRLLEPRNGNLPIAAARAFLKLGFAASDRERMHALAIKHQDESRSAEELAELDA